MCGMDDRGDTALPNTAQRDTRRAGDPTRRSVRAGATSCLRGKSGRRNFVANHANADQKVDSSGAVLPPAIAQINRTIAKVPEGCPPPALSMQVKPYRRLTRLCVLMNPTCRAAWSIWNLAGA
jgi:hypothetical protein